VLVLDADLGLANLDVLFGVRPRYTLLHVTQGKKRLFDIITGVNENLKLIPGGSGISRLADISEEVRAELLNSLFELRKYTDVLIIDTGAGLSSNVMGFLQCADEVLLVATPEPTAMADAYGVIKTLARSDEKFPEVSVLVNRSASPSEGYQVANRLRAVAKQFLDVEVGYKGFILEDDRVSKAVRSQKPFVKCFPESRASLCLKKIASSYAQAGLKNVESSSRSGWVDSICSLFTGKK
jgi:flagellar biosynthesis protein FlhG